MMETVEDIPKHAILTGLPWDWESYGGYLDSIGRLGRDDAESASRRRIPLNTNAPSPERHAQEREPGQRRQ